MAVRKLAGPFPIRTRIGGQPTGGTHINGYYPHVGLIGNMDGGATGVISLDGVFEPIRQMQIGGQLGWWPDRERLLFRGNALVENQGEYELEPKILMENYITDVYMIPLIFPAMRAWVKLRDRRIYVDTVGGAPPGLVVRVLPSTDIEAIWRGVYPGSGVGPGRTPTEVFIWVGSDAGTQGTFYDTLEKTFSPLLHLGVTGHSLWYASEHGVMVSVSGGLPSQVHIWSLEVQPDTISEAVLIRGQAKAGHVATYQVTVTGAQGEPCPDEWLDWTIQGAGRLEHSQSQTDADGKAKIKVIYGLDDTGDSTIKASLRC
jgi:hypothetical protein